MPISRNWLFLLIGALIVAVAALSFKVYQDHREPKGVQLNFGPAYSPFAAAGTANPASAFSFLSAARQPSEEAEEPPARRPIWPSSPPSPKRPRGNGAWERRYNRRNP